MRKLSWFGASLFLMAGTIGCSQSGPGGLASPTSPSGVSTGTAASASQPLAMPLAGPGATYDGSGMWDIIVRATPNGPPLFVGTITFTQDANGNLSTEDGVVLTRKGTGTTISYDVSQFQVRSPCDTILNGQGQINTKKNELSAHVSGTENCNSSEQWVTGTKEPI